LEGLGREISGCYDDNVEMGNVVRFEVVNESAASFFGCNVDVRDVGNVLRYTTRRILVFRRTS
jgi:hypothetical protein